MKKVITMLLLVSILISGFNVNVNAKSYQQQPSDWAAEGVNQAIADSLVPEEIQCDYNKPITRREFATLMVTAIFTSFNEYNEGYEEITKLGWEFPTLTLDNFLEKVESDIKFTDIDDKYIDIASRLGIVNGLGDGTFKPDNYITRAEAAVMFTNYTQAIRTGDPASGDIEIEDFYLVPDWAKDAVSMAYTADYLKGTREVIYGIDTLHVKQKTIFNPLDNITREQAILVVSRLQEYKVLQCLVLEGLVRVCMDDLFSGFFVTDNEVRIKANTYNNEYDAIYMYIRPGSPFEEFKYKYPSGQLGDCLLSPASVNMALNKTEYIQNFVDGKNTIYDFGIITVEHNPSSKYFSILKHNMEYGYIIGASNYTDYFDQDMNRKSVKLLEIREGNNNLKK
ncbi:hypothetical protein SH1V18_11230 [Vallitalea longa]|uniref:SLH domain-containing protein n=1 Tax=Vallitalea longa TaxID=2936439 RepID=A0A9W5YA61_9FIRM|nr:S-layer homology domain-containing protein [Vallitalea longa]GKX28643.1 hypothetical protein SH1V18_11230 [Vallitalea longa]